MAGFLTGTGQLTYNGIVFPNQVTCHVSLTPVYDESDRAVKYTRYVFSVSTVFHNELLPHITSDLDTHLHGILDQLQQPGGTLIFEGKGLGILQINTLQQDVASGPKPRIVNWQPIGDNRAARVQWECEVCLLPCHRLSGDSTSLQRPISVTYSMHWSINEDGLTVRTVSGLIEAAAYRTTSLADLPGRVALDADDFRGFLVVDVPLGYSRTQQEYRLSPDRRQLSVSITDTELASDNPYPIGILRPNVSVSLASTELSMTIWEQTISGNISVSKSHPRWYAWAAFMIIAQQRAAHMQQKAFKTIIDNTNEGTLNDSRGGVIYLSSLRFQEELFSRNLSFSATFLVACSLHTILEASGFWQPIRYFDSSKNQHINYPDGGDGYDPWTALTWDEYRESMTTAEEPLLAPWSARGSAGMYFRSVDDYIVHICDNNQSNIHVVAEENPALHDPANYYQYTPGQPNAANDKTWLGYQSGVEVIQHSNTFQHNPLTVPEGRSLLRSPNPQNPDPRYHENQLGFPYRTDYAPTPQNQLTLSPIYHYRNQTQYYVRFTGWAKRVRYPVPQVELLYFSGYPATLVGTRRVYQSKVGTAGPYPIYLCCWDATYVIPAAPINGTVYTVPNIQTVLDNVSQA
jgi:hypothetical protein